MSDELGTGMGNGDVALLVADVEDVDVEKEELRAKVKELESHIGRQNDIHGKRISQVKDEAEARIKAVEDRLNQALAAQEERRRRVEYSAMSPAERAEYRATEAVGEVEKLRSELAAAKAREEQRELIQGILDEAKKAGIDPSKIDTSSPEMAFFSFQQAERAFLLQKVKDLESRQTVKETQLKEEVVETVRATSGGRRIAPAGSPAQGPVDKLPAEAKVLIQDFENAVKRKNRPQALAIAIQAERQFGIQLTYTPG